MTNDSRHLQNLSVLLPLDDSNPIQNFMFLSMCLILIFGVLGGVINSALKSKISPHRIYKTVNIRRFFIYLKKLS